MPNLRALGSAHLAVLVPLFGIRCQSISVPYANMVLLKVIKNILF